MTLAFRHRWRPWRRQRRADARAGRSPSGAPRPACSRRRTLSSSGATRACRVRCSRRRSRPGWRPRARRGRLLGVVPTPGGGVDWPRTTGRPGPMISASHNPFADNGIKFFAPGGRKLADDARGSGSRPSSHAGSPADAPTGDRGRARSTPRRDARRRATSDRACVDSVAGRLDGLRVVVDCANGAAHDVAPDVSGGARRRRRGHPRRARRHATSTTGCGSTHPDGLARRGRGRGRRRRAGLRRRRRPRARRRRRRRASSTATTSSPSARSTSGHEGALADDTVVVTVMTNLGFRLAMDERGIEVVETAVGDRYVLEALEPRRLVARRRAVGSRDLPRPRHHRRRPAHRPAAARRRGSTGRPLADLAAAAMTPPAAGARQRARSPAAAPDAARARCATDDRRRVEATLGDEGRVLVRPSGTEPLVRVMVEAPTEDRAAARGGRPSVRGCAVRRLLSAPPGSLASAMCGIIAVARAVRPSARRPRRQRCSRLLVEPAASAVAAPAARSGVRGRREPCRGGGRRGSTALRGVARCARAPGRSRPMLRRRSHAAARRDRRRRSARPRRRRSTPGRPCAADARGGNAALVALKDALWAVGTRPAPHGRGGRPTWPAADAGRRGDRRLHVGAASRCRRSTGSRCAAATRPACTARHAATGSISTRPACPPCSARRSDDPLFRSTARCAAPMGACASSTRRRPRSASWATTPRRCAPRSLSDALLHLARQAPTPREASCSATPAGPASASSPRPTPTRSTPRRTSRRRPARTSSAALNGDVDNFADLKAARRPADRRPRSPPTPR